MSGFAWMLRELAMLRYQFKIQGNAAISGAVVFLGKETP